MNTGDLMSIPRRTRLTTNAAELVRDERPRLRKMMHGMDLLRLPVHHAFAS
jgi:hypothetical protein